MGGSTKLMSSGAGGVILTTPGSIASDVTVNLPTSGVNGGTLVCSDSSGNVGLGSTSVSAHLHVYGAGNINSNYTNGDATGASLYLQDSNGASGNGGQILFGANQGVIAGIKSFINNGTGPSGTLIFQTRDTSGNVNNRMNITPSGKIGIGIGSPAAQLDVNGGILAKQGAPGTVGVNNVGYSFGGDGDTGMFSGGDGYIDFYTNNGANVKIDPIGKLTCVANQSGFWNSMQILVQHGSSGQQPGIGFHAPGASSACILKYYGPSSRLECRSADDGGFLDIYAASCVSTSDYRLKENVRPVENALSLIAALQPRRFDWIDKQRPGMGFIAHELQAVVPEAVHGSKDAMQEDGKPKYQGINTDPVVSVLVKAVQEQQLLIEALSARVAQLEVV